MEAICMRLHKGAVEMDWQRGSHILLTWMPSPT